MVADIVAFSRLVEKDEAGTLAAIRKLRCEVLDPVIADYRGRIFKHVGDGTIIEFASIVDAVACAAAIQGTLAKQQAEIPCEPRIVFRIGVNLGDVVVDGEDLLGDGVNIAARLEQICEPGGVLVSGNAYDELAGKLAGVPFALVGEQRLKNIERPVRAYRMVVGDHAPSPERPALPLPDKPSLAVLPFDNLSDDPEQGYFADGIAEEIITALSRAKWLFIIARNSSFAYRGKAVDVRRVGRELGVRYVLKGSVRRAGERVRITGQLIDASTGTHLWADRFDGTLVDVFELQDRVADCVAGAIEPTLHIAEIARARCRPTESLGAYDLYLRAMPYFHSVTPDGVREAPRLLDQALALDPNYPVALGLRAWCHLHGYLRSWADGDEVERTAGEALARRAVALGQDDPMALAMGGFVLSTLVRDYDAGLAALRRALALTPSSAIAYGASALAHCFAGDYTSAIEHGETGAATESVRPAGLQAAHSARLHAPLSRQPEAAADHAARAVQANPSFDSAHSILVASLVERGHVKEAHEAATRLLAAFPHFRVAKRRHRSGFRDTVQFERYLEALRGAGLPD